MHHPEVIMIKNVSNLNQRKMNNHGNSAAEDCIGTKFCTVSSAIMATISCNNNAIVNGL